MPAHRLEDENGQWLTAMRLLGSNWKAGDSIHFGRRTLRVVGTRDDDADRPPVLIVEDA